MRRRNLLRSVFVSGLTAPIVSAMEQVRQSMERTLSSATVSAASLDQWEQTVTGYGLAYMTSPPLGQLQDMVLDFAEIQRLTALRQTTDIQRRLCHISAQLGVVIAMTMVDLGDYQQARGWFRTSRVAAEETEDRILRAWVTARESAIYLYYAQPVQRAVDLARQAQLMAAKPDSAVAVVAAALEARGWARLGAAAQAHQALRRAEEFFERLPVAATVNTPFGCGRQRFAFYLENTLAHLGDRRAPSMQQEALRLLGLGEIRDRLLVELDVATMWIRRGDVTEGVRHALRTILSAPADWRTGLINSRGEELYALIPEPRRCLPAARDLHTVLALPSGESL
ncbi:hypothetical protein [Rhizohabitans arisaemae]|uniref:hypothetical protein n=1 Tax=Rhizohabitans arisaemae TaxID=2720610 RepID=UPI0024B09DE2|nr:hypothetical protein [Rhizohabitans arisaemae]